jgi:arginine exporter protein ArgO
MKLNRDRKVILAWAVILLAVVLIRNIQKGVTGISNLIANTLSDLTSIESLGVSFLLWFLFVKFAPKKDE